jgi:hypothetical protein
MHMWEMANQRYPLCTCLCCHLHAQTQALVIFRRLLHDGEVYAGL